MDTFTFLAGDRISFDFNFLTNELGRSPSHENDYAFVSVSGLDYVAHIAHVNGGFLSPSATPYLHETGYMTFHCCPVKE